MRSAPLHLSINSRIVARAEPGVLWVWSIEMNLKTISSRLTHNRELGHVCTGARASLGAQAEKSEDVPMGKRVLGGVGDPAGGHLQRCEQRGGARAQSIAGPFTPATV